MSEYLYGEPAYSFAVDKGVAHQLQINVDMTVAMPCHCEDDYIFSLSFAIQQNSDSFHSHAVLTVDVRDAVGDRLHISDEFKKEGVSRCKYARYV